MIAVLPQSGGWRTTILKERPGQLTYGLHASGENGRPMAEIAAGAVRIGGNNVWGEHFSGLIDGVRVYERALSAVEIQADGDRPIL